MPDDERLGDLDHLWEAMRDWGLVRQDAPPLTERSKRAIREFTASAPPMTERKREQLLRLLRGSRYWRERGATDA